MLDTGHRLKQRRERQARYRRRQRDGVIIPPVEVDPAILSFILKLRWLTEADATCWPRDRDRTSIKCKSLTEPQAEAGRGGW
jgi:hypothetical protein